MVSDGPHGLRKQEVTDTTQVNSAIKAVCFPAASATSCTFNPELLEKMGRALGEECQAEDVAVLLGPAVNIKRSPLNGRNFEYFSEDPYLTTTMAGALIKGVQSQGVGCCIKHFACNNQESRRLTINEIIDERALREIYLCAFEGAIKETQPWCIMSSYNLINGTHSAQNKWLITDVLRGEWGFKGLVMSDWGAVVERVTDMKAGLDLQMPGPATYDINKLIKAVQNGALDQKVLDQSVTKMLELIFRHIDNKHDATFDRDAHHKLSREICEETVVLMKNEENILPLKKEQKVAFIGEYAEKPRFQGGGSSYINTSQLPSALDAAKEFGVIVQYARAFSSEKDEATEEEIAAAVELAKSVDVAVVFAGLPEDYETEGLDRQHINMPSVQNRVIAEVSKANPNTVVVLHNGGVVLMPWLDGVKGLVELYLGGQAVGQVTVDVLYGKVNPSGHLTESWPKRVEDNPAWLDFPGHSDKVFYLESIFVGYRYYDAKNMEVVFPFGHGLSYTTFEYSNLRVSKEEFNDNEEIEVTVDIKNTGAVAGRAVAQLYVSDKTNAALRPPKELKGFGKVLLQPGETKSVTMKLNKRSFAWYNPEIKDWYCETGNYDILIGESSRKIHLTKTVKVTSTANIIKFVTINTTYMDMLRNPITAPLIQQMLDENPTQKAIMESDNPDNEFYRICVRGAPVRALILFFPFDGDYIDNLIERANKLIKESLEK